MLVSLSSEIALLYPLERRLYRNARAARDASSAAPNVPPTAPPITAPLLLGHSAAIDDEFKFGVTVGVTVDDVAAAVAPDDTVTVLAATMSFPKPVVMRALDSVQQFPEVPKSRQQYTPRAHSRTSKLLAPLWEAVQVSAGLFLSDSRAPTGIAQLCTVFRLARFVRTTINVHRALVVICLGVTDT